jgi:hypothetical protein
VASDEPSLKAGGILTTRAREYVRPSARAERTMLSQLSDQAKLSGSPARNFCTDSFS